MYRTSINFHNRVHGGESPIVYVMITTDMGARVFAEKELGQIFDPTGGTIFFDGSWIFDGTQDFGLETPGIINKGEGRLLSISGFERTIQPKTKDVLNSLATKQVQYLYITLDNVDHYFSKIIVKEPFLTKEIDVYVGFDDRPYSEHLTLFKGNITEYEINSKNMQLRAEER